MTSFFATPATIDGAVGRLHYRSLGVTFLPSNDALGDAARSYNFCDVHHIALQGSTMVITNKDGSHVDIFLNEYSKRLYEITHELLGVAAARPSMHIKCSELRSMVSERCYGKEQAFYRSEWELREHHYLYTHFAAVSVPHAGRLYVGFHTIAFHGTALFMTSAWSFPVGDLKDCVHDGLTLTLILNSGVVHVLTVPLAERCVLEIQEMLRHFRSNYLFGAPLSLLQERYNGAVPPVLLLLLDFVDNHATEGLFRIPGSLRKVEELSFGLDHGEEIELNEGDDHGIVVHDVCSIIKRFFLTSPNQLLEPGILNVLIPIVEQGDSAQVRHGLSNISPYKLTLLSFMCARLKKLSLLEQTTKMGIPNLALVFSPCLFSGADDSNPLAAMQTQMQASSVLTYLIENQQEIF